MEEQQLDIGALVARLRTAGCVFAEEEAALLVAETDSPEQLERMVAQRVSGLPLEPILGWAQFFGLRIAVAPGVFVPRQRTTLMVRQALHRLVGRDGVPVLLDLCCGSGAVATAVASTLAADDVRLEVYASDIDPVAVACAHVNLDPLGACVLESDLFEGLPRGLRGRVDVLVANVPYVPTHAIGSMPPEARIHEPEATLDGGPDGLDVVRRVAEEAPAWLAPGGAVMVETSEDQAADAAGSFASAGLAATVAGSEELGATVVIGVREAAGIP